MLHGTFPHVFTTNPRDPEEGRIFVWAKGRWYEREVGDWGNVTFPPVADSEDELRDWLAENDLFVELTELDDEFAATVRDELNEEVPLYPEAPELSDQPPPRRPHIDD